MIVDIKEINFDYIADCVRPHSHKAVCWQVYALINALVDLGVFKCCMRAKSHGSYNFSILSAEKPEPLIYDAWELMNELKIMDDIDSKSSENVFIVWMTAMQGVK